MRDPFGAEFEDEFLYGRGVADIEGGRANSAALCVLRAFCYSAAFRAEEITDGLGVSDPATLSRFRSARLQAIEALLAVGLFTHAGEGRYIVNQAEISRLWALAGAMKAKA